MVAQLFPPERIAHPEAVVPTMRQTLYAALQAMDDALTVQGIDPLDPPEPS